MITDFLMLAGFGTGLPAGVRLRAAAEEGLLREP
jgi:hypothetical protein